MLNTTITPFTPKTANLVPFSLHIKHDQPYFASNSKDARGMERVGVNNLENNEGIANNAQETIFNNTEIPSSANTNKRQLLYNKQPVRLSVVSINDNFKAEINELINNDTRINLCGIYDNLAHLESTPPGIFPHIVVVDLIEESHNETLATIHRIEEENYPRVNFLAIVPMCNRTLLEKCFYSGVRFVIPRDRLAQNFRRNVDALANRLFL